MSLQPIQVCVNESEADPIEDRCYIVLRGLENRTEPMSCLKKKMFIKHLTPVGLLPDISPFATPTLREELVLGNCL